jgi:hypothetical protein
VVHNREAAEEKRNNTGDTDTHFMDDPVTCTAFRKYRDTDTGTDTLETYLDS